MCLETVKKMLENRVTHSMRRNEIPQNENEFFERKSCKKLAKDFVRKYKSLWNLWVVLEVKFLYNKENAARHHTAFDSAALDL